MTIGERAQWNLASWLIVALTACASAPSRNMPGARPDAGSGIVDAQTAKVPDVGARPVEEVPTQQPAAGAGKVPIRMGEVLASAPPDTGLPPLPRLLNVKAQAIGDSAGILFDPVDGAADYRVYALPPASDVATDSEGRVTVSNAVYRCAGNRQTPFAVLDGAEQVPGGAIKTLVDGEDVRGYRRTLPEATLGYVYAEPGDGRVPVYALGERNPRADNLCYFHRWTASRRKQYVTSKATRDALFMQGLRDDGIAFYAPAAGASGSRELLTHADDDDYGARLYFAKDSAEANVRSGSLPAFSVLTEQAEDSYPLMRVHYHNVCGQSHDELVRGKPRFESVRKQGDNLPLTRLHWSGLSKETTLVIEALDQGCPFQGLLAPTSAPTLEIPSFNAKFGAWMTPEAAQAASPTKELFINGQFEGTKPRPIARSFVKIAPAEAPALQWSFGFKANDTLGDIQDANGTSPVCPIHARAKSEIADTSFFCVEQGRAAQRMLFGELWVMFSDGAADTNGKYRLTAGAKADLSADSYLYVTMDVDSFTTLRRYPQILISDRDAPIQNSLAEGNTLVLQSFADWPNSFELQVCDHKNWDVNDQCPKFDLYQQLDPNDPAKVIGLSPNVEFGEQVGMDFSNRYEMYVSTERAFVFFDGEPYACADLPSAGVPRGPVTVTYGNVLYHSNVDNLFDFTKRTQQTDSLRHFDNLGFTSHVPAPDWDFARLPCAKHLK
jgi:hypothetical protein